MKTKMYLIVSTIIFSIVALVHLLRLAQGWPVELGSWSVPLWVSGMGLLVAAGVAVWGMLLVRRT